MEKLKKALWLIGVIIDIVFILPQAPYIMIMSVLLNCEKIDTTYIWVPVTGIIVLYNNSIGYIDGYTEGHILVKKIAKLFRK